MNDKEERLVERRVTYTLELEGKFYIVGMKTNHHQLFDTTAGDPIAKPGLLMERVCDLEVVLFPTKLTYSMGIVQGISRLKQDIESLVVLKAEYPRRTYDAFKMLDKKYKVKKSAR